VHELQCFLQAQSGEFVFQKVLHGLDVVVGDAFYRFDMKRILFREVLHGITQFVNHFRGQTGQRRQVQILQSQQVLNLHVESVPNQGEFRKVGGEGLGNGGIPAV
jgi:hypothetical protein